MSHKASDIITQKALLLDERLTPLERNAWLTFRALASSDGTVVLSYDALRGYLPSAPGSKRAALETVSRAVLCLRLSTWIALVEYRRNPMTGFSMASRYAVRNQPLAFDDACLEDEDYMPLLERALGHASATIRQLAQSILEEAMRHPDRLGKLPATMQERIRRLQHRGDDHDPGSPGGSTPRNALVPEASGDIPKPVPASATVVRAVQKEVFKEVHTLPVTNRSPGIAVGCAHPLPATAAGSAADSHRASQGLASGATPGGAGRVGHALRIRWRAQRHRLPLRADQEGRGRRVQALGGAQIHPAADTRAGHQQQPAWFAACSFSIVQQPSRKACVARGGATASGSDQAYVEDTIATHRADHRVHG
ncbi:STY4528 family pathogenicity island replication protein [Thauera sinica]|uniref:STY4528 family pathogenicity island replication protein n=1 Tax=Thauera sinica TaxID=2665146 RepID=A0ABW1ATZ9_9RHOO|nr:STY4528 family pathogenicity island replication protein [Thauera sp. K11]